MTHLVVHACILMACLGLFFFLICNACLVLSEGHGSDTHEVHLGPAGCGGPIAGHSAGAIFWTE